MELIIEILGQIINALALAALVFIVGVVWYQTLTPYKKRNVKNFFIQLINE